MKLNIKIFLSLSLLFTFYSCSDYLDEVDPNGVSTSIFWSNLDETEATLNGVYGSMLHTFVHNIGADAARSDLAFPRNRSNPSGNNVPFYFQTFNDGTRDVENQWDACYQVIFRANQVIRGLEGLKDKNGINLQRWTTQMAQARFFRGLVHFYLHNIYNNGQIIIRDKVPATNADFNKPVSTSDEVIRFYRDDLLFAYENLPVKWSNTGNNVGRVNSGAAATILGTSHLYQKEYNESLVYLNDVIDNTAYGYELVRDMSLLFTSAGEFNKESIFEINYSLDAQLEDSQWDEGSFNSRLARNTAPNGKGGAGADHFFPTAWITHAYSIEPIDTLDSRNFVDDGMGGMRKRSVSLRASAMIALVQDVDTKYYLGPSYPEECLISSGSFSWYKKYTNHDIVEHEQDLGLTPWKSGKNLTLNRLADVYLMRAECKIQSGDIDGAIDDINAVRERWALQLLGPSDGSNHAFDEITYSATSLMDHLMFVERPLELSIEGNAMRSTDLRRWGVAKQRFQYLAAMDWHTETFEFINSNGENASCNGSLLLEGIGSGNNDLKEYELAAQNYLEDIHAYFPIPLSEVQNNSSIN